MNKIYLLALLCLALSLLSSVTIYDVQYTTAPGSGTYPSLFNNQTVTIQGIVTSTGYAGNNGFCISMPEGGPWKGILIYNSTYTPAMGTLVEVTGQAYEYHGMTEIRNVTSCVTISTGNPIPPISVVTTANAGTEPYESVLTQVVNATVTSEFNQYGDWAVSDGSGICEVTGAFFEQSTLGQIVTTGVTFESIKGVVMYSYNAFNLNPRTVDDVQVNDQNLMVTLPTLQVPSGSNIVVPVEVSPITIEQGFGAYHFNLSFNPTILSYAGNSTAQTLSSGGTVNVTQTTGNLNVNFVTNGILQGEGTLLNLNFNSIANGVSPLNASNFTFNSTQVMIINQGMVTVGAATGEVVDTLSVIQRPLINIPAIVIPGEALTIECVAPQNTTDWAAHLSRGNMNADLTITGVLYADNPPRWVITTNVPNVPVFDLYDLHVTASGGINDRTRHSVQVLPSRKTNYYFAHITDIHMPSHIFYPEAGWDTDSTETVDFREVIKDLNIIRPEFVLITGDLTNQGPLEDFQNQREFTKAKRLIGELEIPCYLVTGNHDIGGWDDPPMPSGSARKFWWKNFGWSWLSNPATSWQYHTQDYSFDYGPVHYVGLESYDNYDNYLPSVYGSNSFTASQMSWLQADLTASNAETKVLFDHYDFDEELNLGLLNVDLNLWGHIHYDSGSTTTEPYNLATRSVCDGNRSYRIVRVENTTLTPYPTTTAGSSGTNIRVSFTPDNYGFADSVSASVYNSQFITFENSLVRFVMPSSQTAQYTVTNGVLEQVDRSGSKNICYVRVNLTNNSTVNVTIASNETANEDSVIPSAALKFTGIYPNPFSREANISIAGVKGANLSLKIYNLKGELVKSVFQGKQASESQNFRWDGLNANGQASPSGIYLIKLSDSKNTITSKLIHLR
jgi:hypothetical protein